MKLMFKVPATVKTTIEVDAKTKEEAIAKFSEGEFEIVSKEVYDWDHEVYDWDYSDVDEFEMV